MVEEVKQIVWLARLLRKFPKGKKLVSSVKRRASLDLAQVLHNDVIHRMRQLSASMAENNLEVGSERAIEVCTACSKIMTNLLELSPHEVHCCMKVFTREQGTTSSGKVATLARSEPYDNRLVEANNTDEHPVDDGNTVWCALLGKSDGKHTWPRFKCFSCGDLYNAKGFVCSRDDWRDHYRSTLVFPICHMSNSRTRFCEIKGFLAFDSSDKNAFGKLPNIFDYKEEPNKYHSDLSKKTLFHIGALLADTLSVFFEPECD